MVFNQGIFYHLQKEVSFFFKYLFFSPFILFLFYSVGLIFLLGLTSLSNYSLYTRPYLFFALVASIGVIIFMLTSNNYSLRLLKKNWKKIQCLSYLVFLAVLVHSSLVSTRNLTKFYVVFGLFVVLKILEWKK